MHQDGLSFAPALPDILPPVKVRRGVIGFVLSTSVRVPIPGLGISNGLRPGLAGVVKDMADELGPRGIRVVGLVPGRFETDRNREVFDAAADPAAARAEAAAAIPARRTTRGAMVRARRLA